MRAVAEPTTARQTLWALLAYCLAAVGVTAFASWVADEAFSSMFSQLAWAYFLGAALVIAASRARKQS